MTNQFHPSPAGMFGSPRVAAPPVAPRPVQGLPVAPAGPLKPASLRKSRWDPLLIAVAVYIITAVGNIHLVFPVLLPLRPTILGAVAAIGFYIADKRKVRRAAITWSHPTSKMIIAFLAWMTFSVPLALHRGLAYSTVVNDFSKTVVLFFLIVGAVRTRDDAERLVLVYFLGTVINAVFATQNFQPSAASWRMADVNGRWDANDFAVYATTGIPLGIYFAQRYHSLIIRVIAASSLYYMVTGVVLSGSRGGFLALVATLAAVLTQFRAIKIRWRITGAAAAVVILATAGSDQYWDQMRTILNPSEDYNLTSDGGRIEIWKRGIGYALRRPLTGVGAQCFPVAEGFLAPLERRQKQEMGIGQGWFAAHNAYVQALAELGFPGFAFFLIAIGAAIRGLIRGRTANWGKEARGPPMIDAQLASILGYLVGIVFLSHAYEGVLWSQLALAVATWKVAKLAGWAPPRRRKSRRRAPAALAR